MTEASSVLTPLPFTRLQSWAHDDHAAGLAAFQRSAREILDTAHGFKREARFGGAKADWVEVCKAALDAKDGRSFFERHFVPCRVSDPDRPLGLFTGYYEPEADGIRNAHPDYPVPIYKRPPELVALDEAGEKITGLKYGHYVDGRPQAFHVRKEIEQGALKDRGLEIAWLKNWEDAFFMHIQGSGRIRLPDGSAIRLAYALKTGHPYTGIGGVLIERAVLTKETNSMQSIRAWMRKHPDDARELMWMNKSFVFFREVEVKDPTLGAIGAQQVHLTPRRSLAVDRAHWMFGMPIWLETTLPPESGSAPFNHLMVAQDTGSAIKGYARGDVFWGWGEEAAQIAGHMKSDGVFTALLPKPVAASLGL
jgi:membrane-bound lytic murein transglycosylase A